MRGNSYEARRPVLDRHYQRDRLSFGRFVETDGLLDAVVFNDEVFGFEAIDDLALGVFDKRGSRTRLDCERRVVSWEMRGMQKAAR